MSIGNAITLGLRQVFDRQTRKRQNEHRTLTQLVAAIDQLADLTIHSNGDTKAIHAAHVEADRLARLVPDDQLRETAVSAVTALGSAHRSDYHLQLAQKLLPPAQAAIRDRIRALADAAPPSD